MTRKTLCDNVVSMKIGAMLSRKSHVIEHVLLEISLGRNGAAPHEIRRTGH